MVVDPADPDSRSVGSFFMNPVVTNGVREGIGSIAGEPAPGFPLGDGRVKVPAAWLIERAGFLKGHADGAVGISSSQALPVPSPNARTAVACRSIGSTTRSRSRPATATPPAAGRVASRGPPGPGTTNSTPPVRGPRA